MANEIQSAKILVADDDPACRKLLAASLEKWGYYVVSALGGPEALQVLEAENPPSLVVLDWMMPVMDGTEVCRKARKASAKRPLHIILLTGRGTSEDMVKGFEAGADDYITKPFDLDELRARVIVGLRMVQSQQELTERVCELEGILERVRQLKGLVPICSYCRKIRNDQNRWQQVEDYISDHSEIRFSHGICPECFETIVRPEMERELEGDKSEREHRDDHS